MSMVPSVLGATRISLPKTTLAAGQTSPQQIIYESPTPCRSTRFPTDSDTNKKLSHFMPKLP